MGQQEINKSNSPDGAMDRKEAVNSNDRKMKQDFPGYPHNPASEDVIKGDPNWSTDFSNESDTTATGSESVRDERPTERENEVDSEEKELRTGSDRGLSVHDVDPNDPENK
jgi:hypothetical protein